MATKKPAKKKERDWVDALAIANRKGPGTLAERLARLTPALRNAALAEMREWSAKPDPEPAKPEPTAAEREELRLEIANWYYSAKAMIDHLYLQTSSMSQEMEKPDSVLTYWLDPDEMRSLSNMLCQASCKIADIIPPLPYLITDPMDAVRAIRASKTGGQS